MRNYKLKVKEGIERRDN